MGTAAVLVLVSFLSFACPPASDALTPDQLVIVTNKMVSESFELASYYMTKRSVPLRNLLQLETTQDERIEREEYESEIASPLRTFLRKYDPEGDQFKCIVLFFGIPLRINHPDLTTDQKRVVQKLQERRSDLLQQIKERAQEDGQAVKDLKDEEARTAKQIQQAEKSLNGASVDSEIALVMEEPYPLEGWLPNRYFVGFRGRALEKMPQRVLMVSRLDGPSDSTVYHIIDGSIQAETEGLRGKAYFDARWPGKGDTSSSPYRIYDRAIHAAARIVEESKMLPVVLDERERLFQPGEAPDAAIYCGWYSLGKYIDAFTWARGAVGFHVASGELATLRGRTSTAWCQQMLERGVAATLGPVAEPYLTSFPQPDVFFGCLLEGGELVECYTVSNPSWSWQIALIGDPLYRPFKVGRGGTRRR